MFLVIFIHKIWFRPNVSKKIRNTSVNSVILCALLSNNWLAHYFSVFHCLRAIPCNNETFKLQVQIFSLQLMHHRFQFDANGFFDMNFTLALQVSSTLKFKSFRD